MNEQFLHHLKQYADVLVRVGLNLQPGKRVLIMAPVTDDPIIRRLIHFASRKAYEAGASFVDALWNDPYMTRIHLEDAGDEHLGNYSSWRFDSLVDNIENDGGILSIGARDPNLLKGIAPEDIVAFQRPQNARQQEIAHKRFSEGLGTSSIAIVSFQAWADTVLPDVPEDERVIQLWDIIFKTCRIDTDDPVAEWQSHKGALIARCDTLNKRQFSALKFTAPGTDLTVGLPQNHIWVGGGVNSNAGVFYMPNIPTEEVFTVPHRDRVNGTVRASKPLAYSGSMIEDFSVTFKDGCVVDISAKSGGDLLRELVKTDDGAQRLGEVALVPNSSPISQTGLLFNNTLFDENAANHVALGRAYPMTVAGGTEMSPETLNAVGGNTSEIHVDFMIGSGEMDVDGITAQGDAVPVMRDGEWAFDV